MKSLNEKDKSIFGHMLSRHYFPPRVSETSVPARFATVAETTWVEKPYTERIEVVPEPTGNLLVRALKKVAIALLALASALPLIGPAIRSLRHPTYAEMRRVRRVQESVSREVEVEPARVDRQVELSPTRVVALGRGNVRIRAYATTFGTFVTALGPMAESHQVGIPTLSDPAAMVARDAATRSALQSIPWVLDGDAAPFATGPSTYYSSAVPLRGIERELREYFAGLSSVLSRFSKTLIAVDVLKHPDLIRAITQVSSDPGPRPAWIVRLDEWHHGPEGEALDTFFAGWPAYWSHVNYTLFETRKASLSESLAPDCFDLGTFLHYSAFNFYCPTCTSKQQDALLNRDYSVHFTGRVEPVLFSKNSRCVFDPQKDVWRCLGCESLTNAPIPLHKMLDEVLLPAYDHLMEENKVERVKAHQSAREKEIEGQHSLEAELERLQHDYRTTADALTDEMERLRADISGEGIAIASMEGILAAYNVEQNEVMRSIRQFSQSVDKDIEKRTENVLREVNEVKEREMKAAEVKLAALSRAERLDDLRRDAIQIGILKTNLEHVREARQMHRSMRDGLDKIDRRLLQGNAISAAKAKMEDKDVTKSNWFFGSRWEREAKKLE